MSHSSEPRFGFGANWRAFLSVLDEERIGHAIQSVRVLVGQAELHDQTMLDIGSGSGLFSLASRKMGAKVHSFDYDADSVACTTTLKQQFFPDDPFWTVEQGSILDHSYVDRLATFDIVFTWGVLHHTGAMVTAIENAASRVKPGGLLVVALYRKTRLCRLWAMEKRFYTQAPAPVQNLMRRSYVGLMRLAFLVTGRDFAGYVKNYRSNRGMSFEHDVHDWLGGYPYESIAPDEMAAIMSRIGFTLVRSSTRPYSTGVFGSGCDEYVHRAPTGPA